MQSLWYTLTESEIYITVQDTVWTVGVGVGLERQRVTEVCGYVIQLHLYVPLEIMFTSRS